MTTMTIDTLLFVETLQRKGFSKDQAEGLVDAVHQANPERIVTNEGLDQRLRELELRMTIRLGAMMMALGGILIAVRFFA